jgi:hypothetical protein
MTITRALFTALLFASTPALAAPTIIGFDDLPAGSTVNNQYGAKGVTFQGAYIDNPAGLPRSGDRLLLTFNPSSEVFDVFPLAFSFGSGQRYVKLYAGTEGSLPMTATLVAYDAAGNVVGRDGPRTVPPGKLATAMQVTAPGPVIRRVELNYEGSAFHAIDDLEFDGDAAVDVPKTAPTVRITAPRNRAELTTPTFTVVGTVTGKQLSAAATLKVQVQRPPGSTTTSVSTYPVTLAGTGTTRSFAQAVTLGLGPNTITMEAENAAGLRGRATATVRSLPPAIRSRISAEGGEASFGAFSFGSIGSFPCSYAVFARGAVAESGGTTSVVRGPILAKWLALLDQGRFPQLGCPTGDERAATDRGRAQDFAGGRVYTSAVGTFFVPPVLAAAIDKLGGEPGVGLPTSDPTSDSRPAFLTWLFQQFQRPGVSLPATLEIRGDPPRLYVERQAGDGSLFANLIRPSNPTLVQAFDCSTTAGPCPVTPPPDEPLFTGAAPFCNNKEFNWKDLVGGVLGGTPDPPEWVPIRGHYTQTPIWGVLFDVHLASGDNPFAHNSHFEPCPTPTIEALANETICPSDWDLKLRPLPGYRSMVADGRDAVQVEFERVDFQHQLVAYGDPTPGDLVFASGRYIVDCGHGPKFKTEIHPPSVYTAVRSATHNGRPATEADIWVNRFFTGGTAPADAVEFDIDPPPRPSPQSLLGASTPANQTGAVRVTFTPIFPFGPVRVRVTSTRGTPEVTKYGEMKMRTDNVPFGFDGRLHVYWN